MMRFLLIAALAFILAATPALAAIGNQQNIGSHNQAASLTNAITTVINDCPIGSLVVVEAAYATVADTLISVADNHGNSWQVPVDNIAGTGIGLGFAYALNTTADIPVGSTITATFAGTVSSSIQAQCIARAAKNNALDVHGQSNSGLASTGASAITSGTLASADENVFVIVAAASPIGTTTACANFAYTGGGLPTSTPAIGVLTQKVTSASSVSCTQTWTNAVNYVVDMASFAGLWGGNLAEFGAGAH